MDAPHTANFELDLAIPTPSLEALSFADLNTADIERWVANLPLVNTAETTAALNTATEELAFLKAAPHQKFEYVEAIRPLIHYLCVRLDRGRSEQSADIDAKPAQSTAQALLTKLCTTYKSILMAIIEQQDKPKGAPKDLTQRVMHRLISDNSRILARHLQNYLPPPPGFWRELNQVYRLAESLEYLQFRTKDSENHSSQELTIEAAYLRAVLIASCNPNQLHHQQIASVFNALEDWAETVILDRNDAEKSMVIDLASDAGPTYAKVLADLKDPRAIRTEVLAYEIEAYLKDVSSSIPIPESLSNSLLAQLVHSWGAIAERTFRRLPSQGSMRICVGLHAVHYFLSGGVEFADQITSTDSLLRREVNPFLDVKFESAQSSDDDPWSQAHDLKVKIPMNPNIMKPEEILAQHAKDAKTRDVQQPAEDQEADVLPPPEEEPSYRHFEAQSVNTSPGGYCISWTDDVPTNAKVGELIALREEADPRWCIAVIRWVKREEGQQTLGLELLSPRAIPVAARVIQKVGGLTDYTRALLLPEIQALKQPATLITQRVPFARTQKINISR